jgi:hypothetical protein
MPDVPGFRPSTSGLHFANSFPQAPLVSIEIGLGPKTLQIPLGDAANGLSGGMAFATRDYFESGLPAPGATEAPPPGSPLFEYIVQRLFDSFGLPDGPLRYLGLMSPGIPDHETVTGSLGFGPHGRSWVMIKEEWPRIRADLDNGRLCPLGLIKTKSNNPFDLGRNHQVLAYGYDLDGDDLAIKLYDPNEPDRDNVTLSLWLAQPRTATPVVCTPDRAGPVYCFFRVAYEPSAPPQQ